MRHIVTGAICVVSLLLSAAAGPAAQEVMPRSEFIKMADNVFIALDKLEAALGGAPVEMEVEKAQSELEAAIKKTDRYGEDERTEEQREILRAILSSETNFRLFIEMWKTYGAFSEETLKEAQQKADEARRLFLIYVAKKK